MIDRSTIVDEIREDTLIVGRIYTNEELCKRFDCLDTISLTSRTSQNPSIDCVDRAVQLGCSIESMDDQIPQTAVQGSDLKVHRHAQIIRSGDVHVVQVEQLLVRTTFIGRHDALDGQARYGQIRISRNEKFEGMVDVCVSGNLVAVTIEHGERHERREIGIGLSR